MRSQNLNFIDNLVDLDINFNRIKNNFGFYDAKLSENSRNCGKIFPFQMERAFNFSIRWKIENNFVPKYELFKDHQSSK